VFLNSNHWTGDAAADKKSPPEPEGPIIEQKVKKFLKSIN